MRFYRCLLSLLLGLALAAPAAAAGLDNRLWNELLSRHVRVLEGGHASQVDYAGMAAEREQLRAYLDKVAAVRPAAFARWSEDEQLAMLINAYNAATVELVLGGDPALESIKDLGSLLRSPWKQPALQLLGKTRSLDELEHELIRGEQGYHQPRTHFALNCASIGCPALRAEAYNGAQLQAQLADAEQRFLTDRSRNRLTGESLEVSSIFDWYQDDFEQNGQTLARYFASQADALGLDDAQRQQLLDGEIDIEFLDYDWHLNRTP